MANKIQIKRGTGSSALDSGELGFRTDTNTLYIGNNGNKALASADGQKIIESLVKENLLADSLEEITIGPNTSPLKESVQYVITNDGQALLTSRHSVIFSFEAKTANNTKVDIYPRNVSNQALLTGKDYFGKISIPASEKWEKYAIKKSMKEGETNSDPSLYKQMTIRCNSGSGAVSGDSVTIRNVKMEIDFNPNLEVGSYGPNSGGELNFGEKIYSPSITLDAKGEISSISTKEYILPSRGHYYTTCSTAAATAAKTASLSNLDFSLTTGVKITVKFTYANSAANPTLKIGNTNAKNIYWHGAALSSSQYWQAGAVLDFVYDGSYWQLIGVAKDTTYSSAGTALGLVKTGGDVTVSDGIISVNDDSHNHIIDNIDNLQTELNKKVELNPVYSISAGDGKAHYGKLFTITPTSTAYHDLVYSFDVTDRSKNLTKVYVYCSTSSTEKYINATSIQYEGSLGNKITAYRFKDETNKVERLEIWCQVTGWNTWKIYPRTQSISSGVNVEWDGTKVDALPTDATATVNVTAKDWPGNAASATKDDSGNVITSTYAVKSDVVAKTGDTMTGSLTISNGNSYTPIKLKRTRTDIASEVSEFIVAVDDAKAYIKRNYINPSKDNAQDENYVYLYDNTTVLGKPLTVGSGGTGAADAATARTNLEITPQNIGALSLSGGTTTGPIVSNATDSNWINTSHKGAFKTDVAATNSKAKAIFSMKTKDGAWGIANISTGNELYFVYGSDTNYENNTNTVTSVYIDTNGKFSGSVSGNAGTATTLQTARKIGISGGVSGTATSFNGSADISIPVTSIKEAYLTWGGKNLTGTYGPIDAAMIPVLGADRFAFLKPEGITIEYSTDRGVTWQNYSNNEEELTTIKKRLFSSGAVSAELRAGKNESYNVDLSEMALRITVDTYVSKIYTILNKFALEASVEGAKECYCTIEKKKGSTDAGAPWDIAAENVPISGWSGWNIINVGSIQTANNESSKDYYRYLRFTFGSTQAISSSNYYGLKIRKMMAFGGTGWTTPSKMAACGHLYSWDEDQNANFPASIYPVSNNTYDLGTSTKKWKIVYADSFSGTATKATQDASGNVITSTYATKTELNGKQASITGAATTITDTNLTVSRALISNSSGKVAISAVTSTELGYLDGVTSNIQTQLNNKVPTSRTINGKALSSNITLNSSDVGALALTGGTLTGQLTLGRLVANDDWPTLAFARSNIEHAFIQTTSTNSLNFYAYATTELEKAETAKKYWTAYALPAPDEGLSGDENFKGKIYNILTTKNTVTIAQGGTGATDAATARTKLGITPANIGASAVGHKHTKSEITDFPTSLPASDVSAWAKASAKPTYTASEVGAVAKSGDTMTGSLYNNGILEAGTGQTYAARLQGSTDRITISARDTNNTAINYLMLYADKSSLGKPLVVDSGGTGATDAATARTNLGITPENIGAVSKSGDTIAGTLVISNGSSWTPIQIKRTIDNVLNVSELAIDANRAYITRKVDNETINYMYLYNNTTVLGKPLTVESGGTGAITAKQALTNLGVIYSTTQPAGAEGKIWLKPIN